MESCPSWSKEHDWKSCKRPKPFRGFESLALRHKIQSPNRVVVFFCLNVYIGIRTPSAKPNIIGCLRSKRWAEPIESLDLRHKITGTFWVSVIFLFEYVKRDSNPLGERIIFYLFLLYSLFLYVIICILEQSRKEVYI